MPLSVAPWLPATTTATLSPDFLSTSTATTFGAAHFPTIWQQMRAHNQMNAQINKTTKQQQGKED